MRVNSVSNFRTQNSFKSNVVIDPNSKQKFKEFGKTWYDTFSRQVRKIKNNGDDNIVSLRYAQEDNRYPKIEMNIAEKIGNTLYTNKEPGYLCCCLVNIRGFGGNLIDLYKQTSRQMIPAENNHLEDII